MKKSEKNLVAFVMTAPGDVQQALELLSRERGEEIAALLIKEKKSGTKAVHNAEDSGTLVVECDFSDSDSIAKALLPYQSRLLAITCRGDSNLSRFAKIIPHVPYLRTPSVESLEWVTDKYKMRRRMWLYDKKHTPKFALIEGQGKKQLDAVAKKVGFPLVVKPTNLSQSQLVSICFHEEELEETVKKAFRSLKSTYAKNKRTELPQLMAEEYMEGDMYSIDSYVNSRGAIVHCPLVRVKTGKDIGHDDFYNYLRITPTGLKAATVKNAQVATENAIHALALRNTTVHTELMKIDGDWRVIELGPRIGGFRHALYEASCDINHALNDILVRMPKKTMVPKKCKGHAATIRYYPSTEGYIKSLKGVRRLKQIGSVVDVKTKLKIGDKVTFSKKGGKGVMDINLYNKERHRLLADIRRIEKLIDVRVSSKKPA